MATTEAETPSDAAVRPGVDDSGHPRAWFTVLLVGLVAAVPLLLWWGRHQWFFLDEWAFLVNRRLTDPSSMLEAHNGHWVTLPAVVYRLLFRMFGLRSYLPYQLVAVLLHVGVIIGVWLTMRRLRVRPAIATMTALPFVLYGAGRVNILFGFQIALTGSIVFGLAHLLLATDDEPTTRRDVVAVVLGLFAIMCSAVGIPIVVGVALAVLMRRGWRAAAFHAVPLGLVYVAWYLAFARESADNEYSLGAGTLSFVWRMGKAAFVGLGQNGLIGLALAAVAVVGAAHAVRIVRVDRHNASPAIVVALVSSAVLFAALTAFGRAGPAGVQSAATDRYIYVVAALLLPVVALGAEVLAGRWLVLGAMPFVLLLFGVPGNIDLLRDPNPYNSGSRDLVTAVAHSSLLDQLPADTRVFSLSLAPTVAPTVGFLRAAAADGSLPALDHPSRQLQLTADAYVALHHTGATRTRQCPVRQGATTVNVRRGSRIVFSGDIVIVATRGDGTSSPALFKSADGDTIDVRAGPLELTVTGPFGRPPALCRIVGPST